MGLVVFLTDQHLLGFCKPAADNVFLSLRTTVQEESLNINKQVHLDCYSAPR